MKAMIYIGVLVAAGLIAFFVLSNNDSSSSMDSKEIKKAIQNNPGTVIDVRTPAEYEDGHLKLATHNLDLLSGEFEENLDNLDKEETYYLYCRTGNRSGKAAKMMKDKGFENVHNIGGYGELVKMGFEAE